MKSKKEIFRCKQFEVSQENCSMKITTSAMLFGAIIEPAGKHFLEIGAGTGILSLMLAQRSDANIVSLEIEPQAAETARYNFQNSPWKNRLHILENDANEWYLQENNKFELIFSNPPFYMNHLQATSVKDNLAKHDQNLLHQNLAPLAAKLLADDGKCWILTDTSSLTFLHENFENHGFFPYKTYYLQHDEHLKVFAVIVSFSSKAVFHEISHIFVYDFPKNYSQTYTELLKEFLLFL